MTRRPGPCAAARRRPTPQRQLAPLCAPLLALALGACAVGPDYHTPDLPVPPSWSGKGAATRQAPPELAEWWRRLSDPLLNRLVDEAVAGNLSVAAAKARVREARASLDQAVGGLFPTVDGYGSAQRLQNGDARPAGNVIARTQAQWEIDLFGANLRAAEAARYGLDAAQEELRNTLLVLIGDVAASYVEARGLQARLAVARRTVQSQRESEALTRARLSAGGATALDVANAAAQTASTEAAIPALETSLAQTVHRLSVLTGRPPAALAGLMQKPAPIPAPRWPVRVGVPADILLTRPDVRQAERAYAAATARIGEATAALYPSVSLTGNIATSAARLGDLGRSSTISWVFGPSLTVPVFNAGRLHAAVKMAEARRDQEFAALQSTVLSALEEVENAIVTLNQEGTRIRSLEAAVRNSLEALRLSRDLYQSGNVSFLEVLTAERSAFSSQNSLIEARVSRALAWIRLNKALGGGWSGVIDASRPLVTDRNTGPHFVKTPELRP